MLRLLCTILSIVAFPQTILETHPRNGGRQPIDVKLERAKQISGIVRARFVLAAAAAPCRQSDNLFGYNLLISHFTGLSETVLATAARDGLQQGGKTRAERASPPCASALDDLQRADDGLVVLAERVAHEPALVPR